MEPIETKNSDGGVALQERPNPETIEGKLEILRGQVVELTRELFGEDKSEIFAAGVIAGIALIRNGSDRFFEDLGYQIEGEEPS